MRGNPVVRLVFIVLFLGGAGWLVARIAGPGEGSLSRDDGFGRSGASGSSGATVPVYLELVLSSPAGRVRLFDDRDGPAAVDFVPDGLEADAEVEFPVRDGVLRADRLEVEWADMTRPNFLHLTVEPEGLETREVTLHFPARQRDVPLNLSWPVTTD